MLPFRSRRRPLLLVAAAAVAGAVIGAGAVAVLDRSNDGAGDAATSARSRPSPSTRWPTTRPPVAPR